MVTNLTHAHMRKFDPFFVGFDRLWKEMDRLERRMLGLDRKHTHPTISGSMKRIAILSS